MRMCAKRAPPQVVGGGGVGEFVGVDELSDCCIAFLWGKECKLEVLTEVLLCGVISNSWGPWGQPQMCGEIPLGACANGLEIGV